MTSPARILLLGYPLGHSLSPAFQNAGLRHLKLPMHYEARPCQRDALPGIIRAIRDGEILGANVTLPWKEEIVGLVDRLSPSAARVGAVNTLVYAAGRVEGHNTDVCGLRRALARQGVLPGAVQRAVILGAGGAARAAVATLDQLGAQEVMILNRARPRAEALVEALGAHNCAALRAAGLDELQDPGVLGFLEGAQLLLHSTSLGVGAEEGDEAFAEAARAWEALPWEVMRGLRHVQDLCYARGDTPFLHVARARGHAGADGLEMLLGQGMESFLLWTRHEAPEAVMRQALLEARP